jgi:Protein of unknown function (DUF2442)
MNTSTVEQIRAVSLAINEDYLSATLEDGRIITVPLVWYPRLLHATEAQRQNYRWIGRGVGIHWPDMDEDLSIAGFLLGLKAR